MSHLNVEIKARSRRPDHVRRVLKGRNADFRGVDRQIDTYFRCANGLREGNIEHCLIHYNRDNKDGPKESVVTLYEPHPNSTLKEILVSSLGVLVVVEKEREIYFVDNIKFHIDTVRNFGSFVEIEAIDETGAIGRKRLQEQCEKYMELFEIQRDDLIAESYSDMLLEQGT